MERFWSKVLIQEGEDSCWVWQKSCDTKGYGQFRLDGKVRRAHRVAFRLIHGRDPKGILRHRCDNPPCVRPDHLVDGTQAENIQDCVVKGRFVIPPRTKPKTHCIRNHAFTEENIYVTPDGRRQCRRCKKDRRKTP